MNAWKNSYYTLLVLFGIILISLFPVKAKAYNDKKIDVKMQVDFSFNKHLKVNRYEKITVKLDNKGKKVKGTIKIITPAANQNNNIAYEKDLTISKNEKKTEEFYILVSDSMTQIRVVFEDEDNNTIIERQERLKIKYSDTEIFVGLVSKRPENTKNFFDNSIDEFSVIPFNIDKSEFPKDYRGIDSLDIIMVTDLYLGELSKEQIKALTTWVERGGTLLLQAKDIESDKSLILNENKKIYEKLINIEMKKSSVIVSDDEKLVFDKINLERGNILVANFNVELNNNEQLALGNKILKTCIGQLSYYKQAQLKQLSTGDYFDNNITNTISSDINGKIPKVGIYIFILAIYLLIIGPGIYFILRKIDKRYLMWILIPMLSIIFSVIIYAVGNNTRIKGPLAGYVSVLNIDELGRGKEELAFYITAPYNKTYDLNVDENYSITPVMPNYGYSFLDTPDKIYLKSHKVLIKEKADNKYNIEMNNYPAFKPAYFTSSAKIDIKGGITKELQQKDYNLYGNITNNMNMDLTDVIIVSNGTLIGLGNIKKEEKVSIDNKQRKDIRNIENIYQEKFFENILDKDSELQVWEKDKRKDIIRNYIERENENPEDDNFLLGFTSKGEHNLFTKMGIDSHGESIIYMPLNISTEKENEVLIKDIRKYMTVENGYYDCMFGDITSNLLTVEYAIPKNKKITHVEYPKALNTSTVLLDEKGKETIENKSTNGKYKEFDGEILFFNNITKKYDKKFSDREFGEVEDMKPYIDKYNRIKVQYQCDLSNSSVKMPTLCYYEQR